MSVVIRSPNIWDWPAVYETENRALDPHGRLWDHLRAEHDWTGQVVLDIGCGSGYYLPRFARSARAVVGVEPHPPLLAGARRRVCASGLSNVEIRKGTAQQLPVPSGSVDVAHARWAYFFGPGCEPGLAELDRVMRRGGTAFIIDNDASRSTFGRWFRRAWPDYDVRRVEAFFSGHGWSRRPVDMDWRFECREDFESVVRIEFAPALAAALIAEHAGTEVDYAVNVWVKSF